MEIDIYGECSGRFNKDQKTKTCPRQSTLKFLKKVLLFPEKKKHLHEKCFFFVKLSLSLHYFGNLRILCYILHIGVKNGTVIKCWKQIIDFIFLSKILCVRIMWLKNSLNPWNMMSYLLYSMVQISKVMPHPIQP